MIDVTSENLISLAEACRLLPAGRNGRAVHMSCVLRWILSGAKGPGGQRVRLEGVRIGGRWLTSKQAVQRFADRLTPSFVDEPTPRSRTQRQRDRAAERAAQELERDGI